MTTGPALVLPAGWVVAVDGPSGSGKSTVSRRLATRLGGRYLDTGAMYRAVTWAVLQAGVDPEDETAVGKIADTTTVDVGTDPARPTIAADGVRIDAEIRTPEVTAAVSAVSAVLEVRARLVAQQRAIIGRGQIVVEGRDIGTVVAPDAVLKVFLTAAPGVRAGRRSAEHGQLGQTGLAATERDLARRDRLDSGRAAGPLRQADDAVVLDTTALGIDAVVDRLEAMLVAVPGSSP